MKSFSILILKAQSALTTPSQRFSSFQWYNQKRKNSTKADQSRSNDGTCPDFDAFNGRPRPQPRLDCIHQLRRTPPSSFLLGKGSSMLSGVRALRPGTHGRLGPMNLRSAWQTAGEKDDAYHTRQYQKRPPVSHHHPRSPTVAHSCPSVNLFHLLPPDHHATPTQHPTSGASVRAQPPRPLTAES